MGILHWDILMHLYRKETEVQRFKCPGWCFTKVENGHERSKVSFLRPGLPTMVMCKEKGRQRMRWLDVIIESMDFAHTPGNSEGPGSLACWSPWGHKGSDMTEWLSNNNVCVHTHVGFPGGSSGKEPACNAGFAVLVLRSRRSPEGGNGNQLQYSCLGNSMERGAWWLLFTGSQRVGHNWSDWACACMHTCVCVCVCARACILLNIVPRAIRG